MSDSAVTAERTLDPDSAWTRRFGSERGKWRDWVVPVLLFGATVFTTLLFGGRVDWDGPGVSHRLADGVSFAVPLLAILLAHEFGHYFTAMAHGVPASPPFFIPGPPFVGTFGAVIRMRGRIPTRKALIDIGASGPIAGFVVAVPCLIWGLAHSRIAPEQALVADWSLPPHTPLSLLMRWINGQAVFGAEVDGVLVKGQSLLFAALNRVVLGPLPEGYEVRMHPTAFAAWFGLFVTALNLLPVGQFDGGHVIYAVLGERARKVGANVLRVLLILGLVAWPGWLLWAFIGWKVVRTVHPPVEKPDEPLDSARLAIAWVSLAIFVLTFLPVPLAVY